MNLLLVYLLVFVAILMLVYGIMSSLANSTLVSNISSSQGESNNFLTRSFAAPLVHYLADINSREWCTNHREAMENRLLHAGRPAGAMSAVEFIAGCQILSILVFCLFIVLGILSNRVISVGLFAGLAASAIAYWFATEYIQNLASARKLQIARQFPSFLDLAVMAVKAGASFVETINIYADSNRSNALGVEFNLVGQDMKMGSTLQESLQEFKNRVPVEFVRNTIDAIIQGQAVGTPISDLLEEQADMIRFHRSQAAERAAEELKIKIVGPIIFMMIAIFLLILGPAVVEVIQSGISG